MTEFDPTWVSFWCVIGAFAIGFALAKDFPGKLLTRLTRSDTLSRPPAASIEKAKVEMWLADNGWVLESDGGWTNGTHKVWVDENKEEINE